MPTAQADPADRIRAYLARLTPLARSSLLTEIERLQLYGEDVSAFVPILNALRAEFRKSGESSHRLGNPSRQFFKPLELLFVDRPPEKANAGQISRGSLFAIWEWINHELLPAMARDYCETMTKALVGGHAQQANQIASGFQIKVIKSLEGMLGSPQGEKAAEHGLLQYTSSHACMNDLRKILVALQMREAIVAFSAALPPRIDHFDGATLSKVHALIEALLAKHGQALPFALTIVMKRLELPWQLIFLALQASHRRTAEDIARSVYGIAVSMVLDHLDDRHTLLKQALKASRVEAAKAVLRDIYDIEDHLHDWIPRFDESAWGRRLEQFMAALAAELNAEYHTLPGDDVHGDLHHVLEGVERRHREASLLHGLWLKGRDALASGTARVERLVGMDHRQTS
jgi:hypothetical protein